MLFGSDEFSCAFARKSKNVVDSVFTIGRRKAGRGLSTNSSQLAEWARKEGLPCLECDNLESQEALEFAGNEYPDVFLVASFGKKIPAAIAEIPKFGGINVHPSLLPKYRGMAPVARAIMNGETETGVTLHKLSGKIDSGDIILQRKTPLEDTDDDLTLKLRLAVLASFMVKEVFGNLEFYLENAKPQDEDQASWAKAVTEDDRKVHWEMTAKSIVDKCRALHPKPTACFFFRDKCIQLLETDLANERDCLSENAPVSSVISVKPLVIKTIAGSLVIKRVKPPSKKEMTGTDFVNGSRIRKGEILK